MKILLPVDGSKHAKAAVEFVARHALNTGPDSEVILLNAQMRVTGEVERLIGTARLREIRDKDAHDVLKPALSRLKDAGITVTMEIRDGSAAEQIADLAKRRNVDLIVMGARGLSEFTGLFLGSETSKVLASCDTPVVIVRSTRDEGHGAAPRIGIALDGSDFGIAAVRYVLDHAALFGPQAEFTLLHVVPDFEAPMAAEIATPVAMYAPDEIAKMQTRYFEQTMAPARRLFAERNVRFTEEKLTGVPAEAIARHARERKLELLVMGSHGHGRFMAAVVGSVALGVAARCDLPLLLIRRPRD